MDTIPGGASDAPATDPLQLTDEDRALRRPRLLWFNVLLSATVLVVLITGVVSPEMTFLFGVVIALVVNYPGLKQQTARIEAHSMGAMLMATTLLAAGAFLGIIEGHRHDRCDGDHRGEHHPCLGGTWVAAHRGHSRRAAQSALRTRRLLLSG